MATVDHDLSLVLEVHRDLAPDVRLDLAQAPRRHAGMPHHHARFQQGVHSFHVTLRPPGTLVMPNVDRDLSALIGSRICHDLISPIGAIGNGVELLSMSGLEGAPEIALISESVDSASARIRFFRVAFGLASREQSLSKAEIVSILDQINRSGRQVVDWLPDEAVQRPLVKQAFLALLCIETAMPWGSQVTATRNGGRWHLSAEAGKMKFDPELWSVFDGRSKGDVSSSEVQFPLAAEAALATGRAFTVEADAPRGRLAISF